MGIIQVTISLLLANLGVEYFKDAPSYLHACLITWEQCMAIVLYYWLWVRPDEK